MGLFTRWRNISRFLIEAEEYMIKKSVEQVLAKYSREPVDVQSDRPKPAVHTESGPKPDQPKDTAKYSRKLSKEAEELLKDYFDRYDSEKIDRAISSQLQSRNTASLNEALDQAVNQSFVDRVIALINVRNVKDSEIYKAARLDRRLFSKIMSDRSYKPSKDTAIAIALALQLPLSQANDLLSRAGYTLSHSSKRDIVIEYFFRERHYDLIDINLVLYKLGLKPIGR